MPFCILILRSKCSGVLTFENVYLIALTLSDAFIHTQFCTVNAVRSIYIHLCSESSSKMTFEKGCLIGLTLSDV